MKFNNKLLKTKHKFCYLCYDYYETKLCEQCQNNIHNIYNKSILTKSVITQFGINKMVYLKLMVLSTQLQNKYNFLHMDNIFYKMLDFIQSDDLIKYKLLLNILGLTISLIAL
jgi:hypothetical protein